MCRRIALTLVALTAFAVGGVVWLATRHVTATPALTDAPPRPASPEQVHAAEHRLQAALRPSSVAEPIPDGSPALAAPPVASNGTMTVRLAQDDLNTLLADDPRVHERLAEAGVSGVRIALSKPNRVAAVAHVDYQGHAADVEAEGSLSVTEGGELVFTPSSMAVGLLPLPQSVSDKFKSQVDSALEQVRQSLPLRVEHVRVKDDRLVLTGPAKMS